MAKKSVNEIVQKMNGKVLTTREASRLAQNERRKAQRRLARVLSEETGEKVSWKEAYSTAQNLNNLSNEAKALSRTIESLTAKKQESKESRKGYEVNLERVSESISTYTQTRFGQENLSKKGDSPSLYRRNEMFEHQINQATRSEGLSSLDKNETHAFYAATEWIWGGTDSSNNRNALIMQEFGLNDLQQVYDLIVNKELTAKDFGFQDEEIFEEWLEEIRSRVDIDKLREIYHEEMSMEFDEPETKYRKVAIENINIRTGRMKKRNG